MASQMRWTAMLAKVAQDSKRAERRVAADKGGKEGSGVEVTGGGSLKKEGPPVAGAKPGNASVDGKPPLGGRPGAAFDAGRGGAARLASFRGLLIAALLALAL
jgi:hypothetical protein